MTCCATESLCEGFQRAAVGQSFSFYEDVTKDKMLSIEATENDCRIEIVLMW